MMRWIAMGSIAVVAAAAALIATGGRGAPYTIRVNLANAGGLKDGSPVVIGGAQVGTVSLHLGHGDRVRADLEIDEAHAPLGRGTAAAISAVNLLGQKRVQLTDTGSKGGPAPSGYTLPERQVTTSTDLDQVLSVLDTTTRARLAILLDEAGLAVTGRREDFNELLGAMPTALGDARRLLANVVTDNHTLAAVLERSDSLISGLATRRRQLSRLIDVVGQSAATVSARPAQLAGTLERGPRALSTLRLFLAKLREATTPLGPAARDITATAPEISRTLEQLGPFRSAAAPALEQAVDVAPKLSGLATGATPVLRRAAPTASALARLAADAKPVGGALDHSADNIIAVVDNWSKAVQFRDGLSHVFRGEASFSPDQLTSVIDRLPAKLDAKRAKTRPQTPTLAPPSAVEPSRAAPLPKVPDGGAVPEALSDAIGHLTGAPPPGNDPQQAPDRRANDLLDFLLGP
jgi:phospholipid/cholesterol/gamma-HCH transport system substrate-binding protein